MSLNIRYASKGEVIDKERATRSYYSRHELQARASGEIYDLIRNKELPMDSKLILEIPESNKKFDKIEEYIKIAKEKGIEIRFRPE